MNRILSILACVLGIAVIVSPAGAEDSGFGIRAGGGTDITGGIAYGGGINYLYTQDAAGAWELGLVAYGGSFEETSTETYTYEEKTDVFAFGVMLNRLLKYAPGKKGPFVVFGIGAGAVSVAWEERSTGDTSLGTQLPGGGSMQDADGTAGGVIVNLGVGAVLSGPLDLRVETPIIFVADAPGNSSAVLPTITLTAGLRF